MDPHPCVECGFVNLTGEAYCGQCGISVGPATAAVVTARPVYALRRDRAERRQLTVMFCDMVGSTKLSGQLDAEDLRDLMTAFQDACRKSIRAQEGFVARYMGDGMLVYFGYPSAQEDDAERAVRAGLDIVRSIAALDTVVTPGVRVGIATGEVVVGDLIGEGASEEAAVVGETPNLAARLQALSEPGQVLLDDGTRRLTRGSIEVADLGLHLLKGFARPVRAWRAVSEKRRPHTAETDRSPIVGRERELRVLRANWTAARSGDGRVILLGGQAGAGKSRLLAALADLCRGDEYVVLQGKRTTRSTPLAAVIGHIADQAGMAIDDAAPTRADKIAAWVSAWSDTIVVRSAICSLLSVDSPWEPLSGSPGAQKTAILMALEQYLDHLVDRSPVAVVLEDAHWADATTMALVTSWIARAAGNRILVAVTYRPQLVVPWAEGGHVTAMAVSSLDAALSGQLVRSLAGNTPIDDAMVQTIVDRADGVPFFLEELTHAVLDAADSPGSAAVPETLHASLMAKIDRLGSSRSVALAASVLGRTFDPVLLARVIDQSPRELAGALDALVDAGMMTVADGHYLFKHALVRDTAYGSLLKKTRKKLHSRVADLLTTEFTDAATAEPTVTAYHLGRAGRSAEAAHWWTRAAERATHQAATHEAIRALEFAIELTDGVAPTGPSEHHESRVSLRTQLAQQLRLVAEYERAFPLLDAAIAIATEHELLAARSSAHFAAGNLHYNIGSAKRGVAAQELALSDAEVSQSAELEIQALGELGDAYMLTGQLAESASAFQRCIERADELGFQEIAAANAPLLALLAVWNMDTATSLKAIDDSLRRVQANVGLRSLAVTLHVDCHLAVHRGDVERLDRSLHEFHEHARAMGHLGPILCNVYAFELHLARGETDQALQVAHEAFRESPRPGPAGMFWTCLCLAIRDDPTFDTRVEAFLDQLENGAPQWNLVAMAPGLSSLIRQRDAVNLRRAAAALESTIAVNCPFGGYWRDVCEAAAGLIEDPGQPARREVGLAIVARARESGMVQAIPLIEDLISSSGRTIA